ncbi:nucleoside-diphosphate kinase [Nocardia terpenica]|uniref:Nucleoside-diphosphate kinase n=1 Tax=Nocardia terpenica TaxID=455432 RepID=A0A6G9Z084_9NOCA|nr:nucleoside-diphosphate kinase [Nocardia terpenica]QIS18626.1 nucleoside-diphosphate kinase [Nocardia terpenica]
MTNLRELLVPLTPQSAKVDAYIADTYVQEAVTQLVSLDIDPADFARRYSMLLLKPDAIVARAVDKTLVWLRDNGFRVVAVRAVPVDRHFVRALWYFAWNIASPERRRIADLLAAVCDALVLVIASDTNTMPTPVRLAAGKGATNPAKRRPGELRYLLGRHNYLLNLVHSPDDPADVLREFAIYFDERTRAQVLTEIRTGRDRSGLASELGDHLYALTPARDFDRDAALERILTETGGAPPGFDPASDADCARLLYRAWAQDRPLDPWSVIVLGSHVLPMRTGTQPQTLPPVTAHDWLKDRP